MGKFQVGHPGHNAQVVQTRAAIRYLLASQAAVPSGAWEEIIEKAVEDAMSKKHTVRSEARRFLAKILMPADPVGMLGLFLTETSMEDIRSRISQLTEMRDRVVDVVPSVVTPGDKAGKGDDDSHPNSDSE